jgi:RluA family pseudouridine synthase
LADGARIPVLYEDRAVLALDKPPGWMLAPSDWRRTGRNLQAALESGIAAGAFWARARNLKFLRFIHRLDADTSGVVLFAKHRGAVGPLGRLFETRAVAKRYLAVVRGFPREEAWVCHAALASELDETGRVRVDARNGRAAETQFRLLARREDARRGAIALVEARPATGRTHQIRVHLAHASHPVLNDPLYGSQSPATQVARKPAWAGSRLGLSESLALRAVALAYCDPFQCRPVRIEAPFGEFLAAYGFDLGCATLSSASDVEDRPIVSVAGASIPTTRRPAPARRESR